MLKDQKDLLAALNAQRAEYVVIGCHAAIAYGVARLTKDLEVLIRANTSNSEAVYAALVAFGAPVETLTSGDLRDNPDSILQLGVSPNRIDICKVLRVFRSTRHGKTT